VYYDYVSDRISIKESCGYRKSGIELAVTMMERA
jgi:hypothetical protein